MSVRKTRELRRALTAKGFRQDNTHHEMYWLYLGSRKTSIRTRISHGSKDYGDNLLGQMARQLGLARADFDDLIDCPLSGAGSATMLQECGAIRTADGPDGYPGEA